MTDIPVTPADAATTTAAPADAQQSALLDNYRSNNPEYKDDSDYVLSRKLYDSGQSKPDESYPAFASRIGVSQSALETALNKGLTTAAFGLNNPVESAGSGLVSALGGGSFRQGYEQKRQELADQAAVGGYQNPISNIGGDMAGTVADYAKFGPILRAGAEAAVPGVAKIARSGPLGDSIAKFFGLSEANEIPKMLEREALSADPNKPEFGLHPDRDMLDLAATGAEGAGSALVGSTIGKGLSAGVAPLVDAAGRGLVLSDKLAASMPRNIYSDAASKMSQGFTGEVSPKAAALAQDKNYYSNLLDTSGFNVQKGIRDLSDKLQTAGWGQRILQSIEDMASPFKKIETMGDETGHGAILPTETDAVVQAKQAFNQGNPDAKYMARDAFQAIANRLTASDPAGTSTRAFVANVYKDAIPDLLAGGKLLQPPVTGMGALGQALYERLGGGPGSVMWPQFASQPKSTFAGAGSVVSQLPSLVLKLGGYGLQGVGKAIDAIGEPGAAAMKIPGVSSLLPEGLGLGEKGLASTNLPGIYQNGAYQGVTADPATNKPMFPDVYQQPRLQQHSELPTDTNAVDWLGSTDRGSATAFVANRLGPQVGQQLAQTDDGGYRAALFNLASDPRYRAALSSSPG